MRGFREIRTSEKITDKYQAPILAAIEEERRKLLDKRVTDETRQELMTFKECEEFWKNEFARLANEETSSGFDPDKRI